jgi:hypothetical protein
VSIYTAIATNPICRAPPAPATCSGGGLLECVLIYSLYKKASPGQRPISGISLAGKARAFCDIIGDQLGTLDSNKARDLAQSLLPYASGSNLDQLAQIYGVSRLTGIDAASQADDQNFQFYVQSGTFGAINSGQPILVPAGTLIYTGDPHGPIMQTRCLSLWEKQTSPAREASAPHHWFAPRALAGSVCRAVQASRVLGLPGSVMLPVPGRG